MRLWESDLNRVECIPAHFFEEFPSTSRVSVKLILTTKVLSCWSWIWHYCDFVCLSTRKCLRLHAIMQENVVVSSGKILKKMWLVVKAESFSYMKEFLRGKKQLSFGTYLELCNVVCWQKGLISFSVWKIQLKKS